MAELTPSQIIEKINSWVTTNGDKQNTGAHLNIILNAIMEYVGVGYAFMGEAPSSAPSPDVPVLYFAGPGSYTGYDESAVEIPDGSIGLFTFDGSAWSPDVIKVVDPVSVSQNTSTGGHNLYIGDEKASMDNFVNVNIYNDKADAYSDSDEARIAVPYSMRVAGLTIAYKLSTGWLIERALNTLAPNNDWKDDLNWELIDSVKQSDLNSAILSDLIISPIANFISVGNTSLFLPYDIKQGDKLYFRISNAQGASITIGSNQTYEGSGFTQIFFYQKALTDAEAFVNVTDDASYFKAFSGVSGVQITVYKCEETKNIIQEAKIVYPTEQS